MLYGAIIGDIVGSIYEFRNLRSKKFPFMTDRCYITDDSCMTIALASAIKQWKEKGGDLSQIAAESMRLVGNRYPDKGYGGMFWQWLRDPDMGPYNSWGNGAAMRISAASYLGESITEVKRISYLVTSVTHDHIEGIKGAEATAVAIFLARNGCSKEEIAEYIEKTTMTCATVLRTCRRIMNGILRARELFHRHCSVSLNLLTMRMRSGTLFPSVGILTQLGP